MKRDPRRRLHLLLLAVSLVLAAAPAAAAEDTDPQLTPQAAADAPEDEAPEYHGLVATGTSMPETDDWSTRTKEPATPHAGGVDSPGGAATQADDASEEPRTAFDDFGPLDTTDIADEIESEGTARVIVTLKTPVDSSAARAEDQASVASLLSGSASRVVVNYPLAPGLVAEVDSAGLAKLAASPLVGAITLDGEAPLALDISTDVIDSDLLNAAGVIGNDDGDADTPFAVAILDSGVDNQHDAFASRIIAQACFSAGFDCPNGLITQIGGNAGDNCTYSTQCDHGTHVGGIAAGGFYAGGHEGVARGADIVAVQIGHDSTNCLPGEANPCWRYYFSDLDLALQHVQNLVDGGTNIAAVNLSLGGPLYASTAACDAAFPTTFNIVAGLDADQVAVVVAAGNDNVNGSLSYPGCLSNTYAVGATDNGDSPAWFTNSASFMNWWAPGVAIDAPVTTSPTATDDKSGTSMASPHVAGAFALLRECVGNDTDETVAADLNATGVNVTDVGVTKRRINVLDAATRNVNNNDFASAETLTSLSVGGSGTDYDWNVCADGESGEPGPGSIENSIWWNFTPAQTGTATFTVDAATTTFDSQLSVFVGNSVHSLTLLAFDDPAGNGGDTVTLPVNAGTTYRIRVDGFGGSNGELDLDYSLAAGPTCGGVAATIVGDQFANVIVGTAGNDVIVGLDGDDDVSGLAGNDTICLEGGDDTASGGDGADTIRGGDGEDSISGGGGNDSLFGGPDADVIEGDDGDDFILGNAGGGDVDDAGDHISGGSGNDYIDGWVGDDLIRGGSGDDTLNGGFNAAPDTDTVTFEDAPGGVTASLVTGTATGEGNDTLQNIENLTGSSFADTLEGDADANVIDGRGGADELIGRAGNDTVLGGGGGDLIRGNGGADLLKAGGGKDTVFGDFGNDTLLGGGGADELRGGGRHDTIGGGKGADIVFGGAGNDELAGNGGNDDLYGNAGSDDMLGGAGPQDLCAGGPGGGDTADAACETVTGVP